MAQKGKCWARFPSGLSETDGSKDTAVVFVVYCLPESKLSFCHQSDKQTNKQTKTLLHSSRQHHAVVKMKMMTCICPFIVWFMDGDWTTVWWMFQSSGPTCDSTRQFILTVLFKLHLEFSHYYFLLEHFFYLLNITVQISPLQKVFLTRCCGCYPGLGAPWQTTHQQGWWDRSLSRKRLHHCDRETRDRYLWAAT